MNRRAFTLLELLVAMSVLAVLVVMLMGMVDSATKLWRANENRVESYREARAALNLMVSDLKAIFPSTNAVYFSTNAAAEFEASDEDGKIFFLAALPITAQDSDSKSDLCEVGYYLKYGRSSLSSAKQETYSLYRYFKESNKTFTNLVNPSGLFTHTTTNVELLARNIPSFKLNYYRVAADGVISPWVSGGAQARPDFVEIQITALNNEVAKRLTQSNEWKNTNASGVAGNRRTFTARVPISQLP